MIGEATKNLSPSTTEKYSQIPWKEIAGMRDKLIHAYFGVDLEEVWNTVKRDIPELKEILTSSQ
ncbi:HepT-like ribonuclease domain-containing protein [Methanolobus sp. ZRKC3]|uniref:HepT-like ribonuclease domain-containing protein n=1 Tax=Methanolobus sp. ZRKC3 TaxID=3125786 RepID=UPI00324E31B5